MNFDGVNTAELPPTVVALVYELLDAHEDTARLAAGLGDPEWSEHVDYLRQLQRVGRETLAAAQGEQ